MGQTPDDRGADSDFIFYPTGKVVGIRLLVPLGDLSPVKAAPLSDAALTPYHAIKRALPYLNADSTAVVEQAVEVYGKLKAGQITGRAVLIPDSV